MGILSALRAAKDKGECPMESMTFGLTPNASRASASRVAPVWAQRDKPSTRISGLASLAPRRQSTLMTPGRSAFSRVGLSSLEWECRARILAGMQNPRKSGGIRSPRAAAARSISRAAVEGFVVLQRQRESLESIMEKWRCSSSHAESALDPLPAECMKRWKAGAAEDIGKPADEG